MSWQRRRPPRPAGKIALFDPKGETGAWLKAAGITCQTVDAGADLSSYDTLIVGKAALTLDGPAPDITRVRDGLKVIIFEQTSEVLEKRFGFRVVEYGLRNVFPRIPDHPMLAGLNTDNLRDWRGVGDDRAGAVEARTQRQVRWPTSDHLVRYRRTDNLARRMPWQRGLRADRKAGVRRLPARRGRRLQPAVQPADGIP